VSASGQERVKAALFEASALHGADREAFLGALDASEPEVAREVRSLLAERTHPGVSGRAVAEAAARALREGAALPDAGREIGPYRLIEIIGTGGMGAVYRAEQREPIRREVALKILLGGATLGRIAERFASERRALARMDHPGIARILDAGEDATGTSYIAMELVSGVPITRYARDRGLSREEILDLFVSVCRAIQHAHQKGIVHRDLKPSNVLVTEVDGRPMAKIIDFGIARIVEAEESAPPTLLTREGQVIGTLEYMSPEQAEGRSREVDTRADVYSLGVMLYELLAGALPYDLAGMSLAEAITAIQRDPPRPFRQTRMEGRRIDPDLETITRKALEKDPSRRYESVGALADDVERYRRAEPIVARPPSTTYQLRTMVRRNRAAVAVAGAVFVFLAVFAVTMAVLYAGQRREREHAESESRKAEAVNEFLQRMLASANPEEMGRDVTVREVMDQSLRTMETSLTAYPEVRATVEATLGKTYFSLGAWGLADSLVLAAYERMRSAKGERDPATIALLRERAHVASQRRAIPEADSLGRAALRLAVAVEGEKSLEAARCLSVLGEAWFESAPAKAESLLEIAIPIAADHGEDGVRVREDAMLALARAQLRLSRFDESESTFVQVLRSLERSAGARAPRTLDAKHGLSSLYLAKFRYPPARDLNVEVLDVLTSVYGPDHPMTAAASNDLAVVEIYLGSFARAESLEWRAVRTWRRTLGEEHTYVMSGYQNLGYIAHCRTQYEDAASWYRKAIALLHDSGSGDLANVTPYNNLVHVLCDQGRWRDAVPLAERLERVVSRREAAGGTHFGMHHAHTVCGWAFYDAGQFDRSERHWRWAHDYQAATLASGAPSNIEIANLALVQYRLGDRRGADERCRTAALGLAQSSPTSPHGRTTLRRLLRHFQETGADSFAQVCRVALDAMPR